MNAPTRLGVYALGLTVVLAGAVAAGRAVGPIESPPEPTAHYAGAGHATSGHDSAGPADATGPDDGTGQPAGLPGGLQVTDDGYRLTPLTPVLSMGTPTEFAFRIVDANGTPVTRYTRTHEKDLHLIVVRRDLSGFQHVHPTTSRDGTWRVPLAAASAGEHRVFADFQPAGRPEALILGVDVPAAGAYRPRPLPAPATVTAVDGYQVELAGELKPGTASRLTMRISRAGVPVTDVQPYLGAYGHLVVLRKGDLAYLHVHPDGAPGDGRTAAGPQVTFHAEVPSAGTYRLFLDFRHAGRVHTAEFTAVAGPADAAVGAPADETVEEAAQ